MPPTYEVYGELQFAYEHFNRELWNGALPHCVITLQRQRGSYGYFSAGRFERVDGRTSDEIAMNPQWLAGRPFTEVMSTLVHEMAHLWQQHYADPGRGGYHNKQWAREMKRVGLYPSSTGEPGGRETGDSMSHFIIAGGSFHVAATELAATPLGVSWGEAPRKWRLMPDGGETHGGQTPGLGLSGVRTKFTCSGCNAWGKASLRLLCRDCQLPMRSV
jgi:hypothetical protein